MTPVRGPCACPACTALRRGPGPRSPGTIADLVRSMGVAANGKAWFSRISRREARDNLEQEIERWFAERGSAAALLARLSGGCLLIVGMLVEAPAGLTWAEIELEMQELGCGAIASRALAELSDAGLLFLTSPTGGGGATEIRPNSWLMLPGALRDWLAPAALPLLLASGGAPPPESPAGDSAPGNHPPGGDPALAALIWLGAVRATGGRITEARLYKKDREKIEALAGLTNADETLRELLGRRLIRIGGDRRSAEIRPCWDAFEAWLQRSAAERAADYLGRRHGGTLAWETLIDSSGDWVEELHLARRSRLVTSTVYARPAPDRNRRRESWARQRAVIRAWPEVEERTHQGRTFFRLRPSVAAPLRDGSADHTTAKIFVQPDFEVLVPRDASLRAALLLTRAGRLIRGDVVLTFKLTPESVRRAAAEGLPAPRIVAELEKLAAHGVPPAVARAVHDWAANVGRCAVVPAVLARFDDESLAARAAQALGDAAERVGPSTLIIHEGPADDARELLEKAGFPPRGERRDDDDRDVFDMDEPFGDDGDEDDDGYDDEAEVAAGHAADGHGELPEDERGSAHAHRNRVAGMLGLSPALPRAVPESRSLKEIQAARSTAGARQPSPTASRPEARAATSPEAIAKTLRLATEIDAEVVLGLADGSEAVGRPLLPPPGPPDNLIRFLGRDSKTERLLPLQSIRLAGVIHGTARAVSRNQPCPCGSGRKFKRCCGANSAALPGEDPFPESLGFR